MLATDTGQPLHSSPAERLISSQSLTSENLGLESLSHTPDSSHGCILVLKETFVPGGRKSHPIKAKFVLEKTPHAPLPQI